MLGLGDSQDTTITIPYPLGTDSSGGGGGTVVFNNQSSVSWLDILNTGLKSAAGIFSTRYAVPQLNPGQLIQGNGMTMYQGTVGSSMIPSLSTLGGSGMDTMLLLGGGALLLLMMAKKG